MEIVRRVHAMKNISKSCRGRGQKIGFVPTMGCLHEGHLSLIRRAKELCDVVVVSIFVNPTQFGEGEDFASYPRDITRDADLCIAEGVEYLFTPEASEIYSAGPRCFVEVEEVSALWEGASRPGHFRGVATVVTKLLNVVQPAFAIFGQKDAQQAVVIRRMVEDLMMDSEVIVAPIVRDDDGLALSSRNRYLSESDREAAVAISHGLEVVQERFAEGVRQSEELLAAFAEMIERQSVLKIDYCAVVDPKTMQEISEIEQGALMIVAVHCKKVRLLDNVFLKLETASE